MHILLVTGALVGGIRKHIVDILEMPRPPGVRFSLACSTTEIDALGKRALNTLQANGMLHAILPLSVAKRPQWQDVKNIWRLQQFVRSGDVPVTLLHGHNAKGGLYVRLVSRLTGTPCLYTPHGGALHPVFSPLATQLYQMVERGLAPWTDGFVCESDYTKARLLGIVGQVGKPIYRIYNGVASNIRVDTSAIVLDANYRHVGVFAALRHEKGQDIAISALAKLSPTIRDTLRLHFFGSGQTASLLRAQVEQCGLMSHVVWHGDCSDVMPWMQRMDLVLIPSRAESFGYVACEAGVLRRPVIASRVGGLCEIVTHEESGYLFEPGDAAGLAVLIQRWLEHPAYTQTMACALATKVATTFPISRMQEEIMQCYVRHARADK